MNENEENPPPIIKLDGTEVPHGTYTAYNRWGCRCTACRAENATIARNRRGVHSDRSEPEHGTRARYTSRKWKCRCDECKKANSDYVSEWKRLKNQGIPMNAPWDKWTKW